MTNYHKDLTGSELHVNANLTGDVTSSGNATTIPAATITPGMLATGSGAATVATAQTTASTTYADLTTAGPSVTVTVGANGLALVGFHSQMSNNTAGAYCLVSVDVSGANTSAATDTRASGDNGGTQDFFGYGNTHLFTGLSAGSTTFKLKYRVSSGTGTFTSRHIWALPL